MTESSLFISLPTGEGLGERPLQRSESHTARGRDGRQGSRQRCNHDFQRYLNEFVLQFHFFLRSKGVKVVKE